MSDWLVLVDCFVNMYVVNLRMLIICTCMSVILCSWLIVTCMLYRLGRVYFVSKDEREMWRIVSWECGILDVNHQVVVRVFAWLESQLFEEACFVNLCLVDGLNTKMVYTPRCKSTWRCSPMTFVDLKKQKEEVVRLYSCMSVFQG